MALSLGLAANALESQTLELDRERLERIEDLSESLANQLLEMSVALVFNNAGKLGFQILTRPALKHAELALLSDFQKRTAHSVTR